MCLQVYSTVTYYTNQRFSVDQYIWKYVTWFYLPCFFEQDKSRLWNVLMQNKQKSCENPFVYRRCRRRRKRNRMIQYFTLNWRKVHSYQSKFLFSNSYCIFVRLTFYCKSIRYLTKYISAGYFGRPTTS